MISSIMENADIDPEFFKTLDGIIAYYLINMK